VWQFTGSVLVMVGGGYALDVYAATKPWGLIVGGMVGSGVGFYAFIRTANRLMQQESDAKKQQQNKRP
jgi:F0F1-type ATP synthase assembly protein I